ncbi:WD40/YVTN/BNR-like repeat-containing protein [Fodinibius roseus]|nr:glycosyl hydrolase [Fodinibius roseus]
MIANSDQHILLIGTNRGVYRVPIDKMDEAKQVLDTKHVLRVRRFGEEILAATRAGLFRSTDRGESWVNLNVPRKEVYSVYQEVQNKKLYAGTHPAHLYLSDDGGESWRELEGLQSLPSRNTWHTPRHRNEAHVRSLGGHADAPGRLIAGIEVGGVHVSEDGGKTWTERRDGLHDDIHHVLITEADEYIASTGGGLYRSRNAGRTWTRLDNKLDHTYFREAFVVGGRLYAAAARSAPPAWGGEQGADAALFESADGGDTFHSVAYAGQPEDLVLAWTVADTERETVFAGTRNGHILRRTDDKWRKVGSTPSSIRSLTAI